MPKQHKGGSLSQKNKPFKGGSKRQAKEKTGKILKKTIAKQTQKMQQQKKPQMEQQKTEKIEPQVIKQNKTPKIVAVIPFNQSADTNKLRALLSTLQEQQVEKSQIHLKFSPGKHIPFLKQNLQFIFANNNFENILDICKVADMICPVLSCKNANVEGLALDPQNNASAFDGFGYKVLSALRVQGLPPQVCIIQGLEEISANKKHQVKKLFNRYFTSEFGADVTVLGDDNPSSILRYVQGTNEIPMEWRDQRGYMLPDQITYENNLLVLQGYWIGTTPITANQLVHITGVDDLIIDHIDLIQKQRSMEEESINTITRDESIAQQLDPLCRKKEDQDINEQFLNQICGLDLGQEELQFQEKKPQMDEEGDIEQQDSDVSCDELEAIQNIEEKYNYNQKKIIRKLINYEIAKRANDELEFEDEIEYDVEVQLRERYQKYQGLKNFRDTQVDPYTFLPDEVDSLYNIRNLARVKQDVINARKTQVQSFQPGSYLKLYLRVPQEYLQKISSLDILIVSGLLEHERKMTQVHAKIRRTKDYENPIESKKPVLIQVGFRRAFVEPIYSRIYNNCPKTKYTKTIKDDTWYLSSFYFYCTFPPSKVMMFASDFDYRSGNLMCSGDVYKCETFQVIMKRVILTGYPFKINKRKAVVRLMFFNPQDIRYFKPVDLTTKLGLRGNILEPLGTHGLMKCMFSNYVKPHDTICLHLYKRVHPRFPQSLKGL